MKLNETKYGFKLVKIEELKDLKAKLYHYYHEYSHANLVHLENDDDNCAFTIGFRTPPFDDSGVCHIIEHSVLCGSEKYPLKEPFVNLLKSSLNTFLNAFTAYDWTMYPFSSQTPKDFDNVLKIYTDAVFRPIAMKDERPFLQEGWHLEIKNKDDIPSYKGVVYNEMKGDMSSYESVLEETSSEAMYPDTIYRFNSGGDPDAIPTLTYEKYKDFYHKHYKPSNALTYFYGKMDIEERLKFLDEEYFSKYPYDGIEFNIEKQKPVINMKYEKKYAIGKDDEVKNNYHYELAYALCPYENYEEVFAWQIFRDAYMSSNDSPLKKVLLDAKLGEDIDTYVSTDRNICSLQISLKQSNKGKGEKFYTLFENEIKKYVKEGLDHSLLLASINNLEFKEAEQDFGRFPKGLVFGMSAVASFVYDVPISSHLEFSKHFAKLKKELDKGYFEKLLEKYILGSIHKSLVTLVPSQTLQEEKEKKMLEEMKKLHDKMSDKEKEELLKLNERLLEYQNHVDTKKELLTLPKLNISDIRKEINEIGTKKFSFKGYKGIYHDVNTNGIAYYKLYFNLKALKEEDYIYVSILRQLLTNVKTKEYSLPELKKLIKTYLGDFRFSYQLANNLKVDTFNPYLKVSLSCLKENLEYVPLLLSSVLNNSKFDKKTLKTYLAQLVNGLKEELNSNGMALSMMMAQSHYSKAHYMTRYYVRGYEAYMKLSEMNDNFEANYKTILAKLKEILKVLVNKKNLFVSLTTSADMKDEVLEKLAILKIKSKKLELFEPEFAFDKETRSEALITPSTVSYNACAFNMKEKGYEYFGKYKVVGHINALDYLWNEVRVKGGAYGSRLAIGYDLSLCFGSYRDPNVLNTYEVYKNIVKYLENFKVGSDDFKSYIIGAVGTFDTPESTPSLIDTWDANFLSGLDRKDILKVKKELIGTKLSDMKDAIKLFEDVNKDNYKFTIGNESKIKEMKFDKVYVLK